MTNALSCDEELVRRLPQPLAQLYRRAHNAKTPLDRHQAAYFLWEASLKLLGSVAIVLYAEREVPDPKLLERLTGLARPSVGQWWEFVRLLAPVLAEGDDAGFRSVSTLLPGRKRDDLPRTAGLDAVLRETLQKTSGARVTVCLGELFDRLVQYRNSELGHGAAGQRSGEFYDRVGRSLLSGVPELLSVLDVLAGRRLVYLAEVRQQSSGRWLLERYHLTGETARRLDPLDLAEAEASHLPRTDRVYLETDPASSPIPSRVSLHPLVLYDAEANEVLFFNARRGRQRTEYLCYHSGRKLERQDLGGESRASLIKLLDLSETEGKEENPPSASEDRSPPQPAEKSAPTLGEFELLSKLGRGGMGIVYRAWQPALGRQVALKCLLRVGDPRSEDRFRREILALGRVEHPHLVKVFTSGAQGEDWFYAMELIEGATLSAVCDKLQTRASGAAAVDLHTWQEAVSTTCEETRRAEEPLAGFDLPSVSAPSERPAAAPVGGKDYVSQVVELIRQAAEACHALHQAGMVHRDIKPGNIMVSADGARTTLMDLGLVQFTDTQQKKLTQTRQFVGTLRYASPEQVLAVARLDGRSDVYSLGATLWELLTLRTMFGATDETPTPELMQRIQFEEPERIRKYNPGVAPDLEAIVLKCLEKAPSRRYASARELSEDLGRWLRGESVHARRRTLGHRLVKRLSSRRRGIAIAAGLVALQLALLLVLAHWWNAPPAPTPMPVVEPPSAIPIAEEPEGKGRALLIGCTRYDHNEDYRLEGPANDVLLMRKLLTEKCQFADEDIITLSEAAGSMNASKRPLRRNIEREFQHLADVAEPGDRIVVCFNGGGSRQPAVGLDARDKPEGLDFAFVPADAGKWDNPNAIIPNAITGDQLAAWMKAIASRKAFVWLIYDSCNGGSSLRHTEAPGLVATYCSQPKEQTVEKFFPEEGPNRKTYGLFTYTLCQILFEAPTPLTYHELVQRVRSQYAEQGRTDPTPWDAGSDRNQLVLGGWPWLVSSPSIRLQRGSKGGWKVNAGALYGLTPESILALKKPGPTNSDRPVLGYLRVSAVGLTESEVGPCAYAGLPPPRDLNPDTTCEVVYVEYGDPRLRVAVDEQTEDKKAAPKVEREKLNRELQVLAEEAGSLFRWVAEPQQAQWVVRLQSAESGQVYVLPANPDLASPTRHRGLEKISTEEEKENQKRKYAAGKVPVFGPIPAEKRASELREILGHLARGTNLLALCKFPPERKVRQGLAVDIQLDLVKLQNWTDQDGKVVTWESAGSILSDGDWVAFRVTNRGRTDAAVTVLLLDSDYHIQAVYPGGASNNRVRPGQSVQTNPVQIHTKDFGFQHAVALAVESPGAPTDFSFLAEPTLEGARTLAAAKGMTAPTLDAPLSLLLQNALYGRGQTRGLEVKDLNRCALRKLFWKAIPKRGPKK